MAYHPESNGALKRFHRTLAEYLRHYINAEQTDWDVWIPYAMFAYNTTPHTATGFREPSRRGSCRKRIRRA